MTNDEMNDFVLKYLPYNEKGKKDGGEVFTPVALIEKMLDELNVEVWGNPLLKWLEPTCGVGNFMVRVYLRLMDGLSAWEPDLIKRSKHIIGNMLYMVELNEANAEICRSLFGGLSNVKCMDILDILDSCSDIFDIFDSSFDMSLYLGMSRCFDIILGNLPFQSKSCLGGKSKLYEKITLHCLQLLKSGGYMLLITPDNIFSGGSKVYKQLVENKVSIINLDKQNQPFFPGIQQYICYFLLCKCPSSGATVVKKNDGKPMTLLLRDRVINPVRNWNEKTEELICKYISEEANNVVYNRGKNLSHYLKYNPHLVQDGKAYELIYTPEKMLYTYDKHLYVGGGVKKIIVFSISTRLEFKEDLSGQYGVGPNTFYIPVSTDEEGKRWIRFLESDEYKTIALATKTNRQFLKNTFIQHLICPN